MPVTVRHRCVVVFARSDAAEARSKGLGRAGAVAFARQRARLGGAVSALEDVDLVVCGVANGLTAAHHLPQRGASFGARLTAAVQDARALGYRQLLVVGLDAPGLRARHLSEAFAALDTHGVVLGPASDGGIYLLGLDAAVSSSNALRQVRWLGRRVQRDLLHAFGAVEWLEPLTDIDGPADARCAARADVEWSAWRIGPAVSPAPSAVVSRDAVRRVHPIRGPPAL